MTSIGSIGGAAAGNPLNGLGGTNGFSMGGSAGNPLAGLGDGGGMGLGVGGDQGAQDSSNGGGLGVMPNQSATGSQGASFADALKTMVVDKPSASKAAAGDMMARFAAGDTSIDPHKIALASAKAGVEIQMATRTISSAVSGVRTLLQMQV